MRTTLHIDTTSNQQIKVSLTTNQQENSINHPLDQKKAQIVLPLISQLLQEKNLTLADITQITINPGPGSFTGIRVGLAIANTLGFLLKIPVNGLPPGQTVEAQY